MDEPNLKKHGIIDRIIANQLTVTIVTVVSIVFILIGASYAILTSFSKLDESIVIKVANMEVTYSSLSGDLTLPKEFTLPVADTMSELQIPYSFTITNTGSIPIALYLIRLVSQENKTSTLPLASLRFSIQKDNGDYTDPVNITNEGIIYEGLMLDVKESTTFNLRIWINENATGDVLDKIFYGAIEIKLYQEEEYMEYGYAKDLISSKIVTNGDGVYIDFTNNKRYIYRGNNPNNYLTINGEKSGWRIMAVEEDGSLMIIKDKALENEYDFDESTNPRNSTGYCKVSNNSGCNVWYGTNNYTGNGYYSDVVSNPSTIFTSLNTDYYHTLSKNMKKYIISYPAYFGNVAFINESKILDVKLAEEKVSYSSNIKLLSLSDYMKSTINDNCQTIRNYSDTNLDCTNYLYNYNDYLWTLTSLDKDMELYRISTSLSKSNAIDSLNNYQTIKPVIHLSNQIPLSGSGTIDDPYKLCEECLNVLN